MAAALVALALLAAPAVELRAKDVALTDAVLLRVELASADGRAHRVRLAASSEGGLRLQPGEPLAVPASGSLTVERLLFRGAAPRASRHELRLVALEEDGSAPGDARLAG